MAPRATLEQNVSNPFSGTTAIRFALPVASPVKIELFDPFGRRIKALADGHYEAGYRRAESDRRDDAGCLLHSGVFRYRMTAGGFSDRRRLVILGN